jgi:hypothetical protein
MKRSGFSLIEVNMAVFVLAIGVLSMAVLYPLGLRESIQSQADLKQSMFADFVLNVAVATASGPDVTRAQWDATFQVSGEEGSYLSMSENSSHFVIQAVVTAVAQYEGFKEGHKLYETYAIYCTRVAGSDRIMSIMVRSLDMDTSNMSTNEKKKRLASQPFYYAEAFYQGAQ